MILKIEQKKRVRQKIQVALRVKHSQKNIPTTIEREEWSTQNGRQTEELRNKRKKVGIDVLKKFFKIFYI